MKPEIVTETYLREVLAGIEQRARAEAQPWLDKLAELEALKPPAPFVIPATGIFERQLGTRDEVVTDHVIAPMPRLDYEPAWRVMHGHLAWMQGCKGLPSWSLGLNLADIATRLIDRAYPGLREGTLSLRATTIDPTALDDMRELGVGFEVDGKRVHPSRVIVHRRAATPSNAGSPNVGDGVIPAGMVRWHGGDSAPADWDGGPVLSRAHELQTPEELNQGRWDRKRTHAFFRDIERACDIIAYTPRATSPTVPAIPVDREWQTVPVEPTKAMMDAAAFMWKDDRAKMWSAILAASPAYTPRPVEGSKPGWDVDGMCDDHGRFACSDCAIAQPVEAGAGKLAEAFLTGFDAATKLLDDSIALGDLRWPEIRSRAAKNFAALTTPAGGIEEGGRHE